MRKVLTVFFAVCLVLSLFTGAFTPVSSLRALTDGDYTYSLNGTVPETATITMNGNKTVSAIFTAVPTYTLAPSAGTRGTITTSTPPRLSSAAKSQDVTLVIVKP